MNKIYIIISIILLSSSCSKLDNFLDKAPESDLSYVETISDCDKLLNNPALIGGVNSTYFLDDCIAFTDIETRFKPGKSLYREYIYWSDEKYLYDPSQDDPGWNKNYSNIYYTNIVLDRIDKVAGTDETLRSQIKGEAFLGRAFYHFMLVNLYAKQYNISTAQNDLGVPIAITTDLEISRSRATVQNVYDQIIEDINESINHLKVEKPEDNKNYRGTLAGAYALLSKVYFYMQNWDNTIKYGELSLGKSSTITDYNTFANYAEYDKSIAKSSLRNPETTYLRGPLETFSCLDISMTTNPIKGPTSGGLYLTPTITNNIDTKSDLRYKFFMTKNASGKITICGERWMDPLYYGYTNCGTSTWETTLILAESYARTNKTTPALEKLNSLCKKRYNKSDYKPFESTDSKAILKRIGHEKIMESVYTSTRWFEMRRLFALGEYNQTIVRYSVKGEEIGRLVPSATRMVLPIAGKVTNINPNITPNPFE